MVQMELLSVQVYSHVKLPIQKKLKVSIKEKKTLFPIVFQSECSKITKRNLINYHNFFFSFLPSSPLLNWFIIIPCNTTSSYKCWLLIFDKKKKAFHSISQQSCWVQIQSCSQCIWLFFHCALHEGSILGNKKKCLPTLISQIAEVSPLFNVGHPRSQRSRHSSLALIHHLHAKDYYRLCIFCLFHNTAKDPNVFQSSLVSHKMTTLFFFFFNAGLWEINPPFVAWSGICTANYCFNSLSALPNLSS